MARSNSLFSSNESARYAAECRRLAALSRRPKAAAKQRVAAEAKTRHAEWLSQIWSPPGRLATR